MNTARFVIGVPFRFRAALAEMSPARTRNGKISFDVKVIPSANH